MKLERPLYNSLTYIIFRLVSVSKSKMNKVYISPSFCRLVSTSYVAKPFYNTTRTFSWERHCNDRLISHLTRTTQNVRYVPNRQLGWLLAPPLKPGQKGYERQRKMYRRGHIFLVSCSIVIVLIMRELGYFLPGLTGEEFHNAHKNEAERMRAKKQMQDEEMMRLAELRKKNVEKYFPVDSDEKSS